MSKHDFIAAAPLHRARRLLPWLLLLFAGSGCSALIYEIVWFQLLQLVIGSAAVSIGMLLGTFMGGMCLGSIALPRLVSPRLHPLRVYAVLELGLAIIGIAVLFGIPHVDHLYLAWVGSLPAFIPRGIVCAAFLLPPTVLMGATLPAVARWVEQSPQGVSWLGLFYGGNIAGAIFGCLLAGFYLLRVYDMATATYVAASVNAAVAVCSWALAGLASHEPRAIDAVPKDAFSARGAQSVFVAIALSGSCALAAEVIWTRLLSLMLGATVYTFSIILAVFLVGLGIGSAVGALLARVSPRPRLMLGYCQLLVAAGIAWTAAMVAMSLPYWPINPFLSRSPWLGFQLDLVRCLWAILPATCLWGASFPLALAAGAKQGEDPGRLAGGMCAANTAGAIVGALAASLFLIRYLGTQNAQRVLIALSVTAGALMVAPYLWPFRGGTASGSRLAANGLRVGGAVLLAACVAGAAAVLTWSVPATPWELVAFGRYLPGYDGQWQKRYMGEGMQSSVAVTELPSGETTFHVNGRPEASSARQDMRLQRMLGHLPALFHANPHSVLIVGCGAGITAGCFVLHPAIEKIVICDIEPLVPQAVAPYFAAQNYDVVHDPRVEIIYDDARHYLLTTPNKFDIITSDPVHPWVRGSATLYTTEYFELCKSHLNPGGLISQWVPLYESSLAVVQSELATFFEVFPDGTIWSNDQGGRGYDSILLYRAGGLTIDADALQRRLLRPHYAAVMQSLGEVGFPSAVDLLATYGGHAGDLRPWLEHADVNRDRSLRLQYLAGLELNKNQGKLIHNEMVGYRRFRDDLFVGTGYYSHALRAALERATPTHQERATE